MIALWLSLALAQAPADPPMRPLFEVPLAPVRPGPFFDEDEAFAVIQQVYAEFFPQEVHGVDVAWTAEHLIPQAAPYRITAPRFLGDGPHLEVHLSRVSDTYYGGRLVGLVDRIGSRDAAREAYQAFMTAALAHELAHSIGGQNGAATLDHPWQEETRAIDFELAVLQQLIDDGRVPASWLDAHVAFNEALLAAAPEGLVAALPADPAGREALFDQHYPELLKAANANVGPVEATPSDIVLALYTVYRLDRARDVRPLAELAPRLEPPEVPPETPADVAAAWFAPDREGVAEVDRAALRLRLEALGGRWWLSMAPGEAQIDVRLDLDAPVRGKRRRRVVLEGLNTVNQDAASPRWVLDEETGALALHQRVDAERRDLDDAVTRMLGAVDRYGPLLMQLAGEEVP